MGDSGFKPGEEGLLDPSRGGEKEKSPQVKRPWETVRPPQEHTVPSQESRDSKVRSLSHMLVLLIIMQYRGELRLQIEIEHYIWHLSHKNENFAKGTTSHH